MKESVKKWVFGILKAALVIGIGGYCVLVMSVLLAESPSGARNPPCLLIMPGLLRATREGV